MKNNFSIGQFYHCYNRGTDKRKTFLTERDYLRFSVLLYVCNSESPIHISNFEAVHMIELFNLERGKPLVAIRAWNLMPNHFHLFLKEIRDGGISLFMQKVMTGYTMYFNKKSERTGSLFGSTFKSEQIDRDVYGKYILSYIHLNPVKIIDSTWKEHGLKDFNKAKIFLENYRWSSYLDYRGFIRPENKILARSEFPEYFKTIKEFDSEIGEWLSFSRQGLTLP